MGCAGRGRKDICGAACPLNGAPAQVVFLPRRRDYLRTPKPLVLKGPGRARNRGLRKSRDLRKTSCLALGFDVSDLRKRPQEIRPSPLPGGRREADTEIRLVIQGN